MPKHFNLTLTSMSVIRAYLIKKYNKYNGKTMDTYKNK